MRKTCPLHVLSRELARAAGSVRGAELEFAKVAKKILPTEEVMLRLRNISRHALAILVAAVTLATMSVPAPARYWHHHWYGHRHWYGHYYGYYGRPYYRSYYYGAPYYYPPPYYAGYYYPPYYAPYYYGGYGPGYYYGGPSISFGFAFGGGHHHW